MSGRGDEEEDVSPKIMVISGPTGVGKSEYAVGMSSEFAVLGS